MQRLARAKHGLFIGLGLAGLWFLADLAGAALAIGFLFDFTLASLVLVVVAMLAHVGLGALVGALAGALWPARWDLPVRRRHLRWGAAALAVLIAGGGYLSRQGRQLPELPPRPPVT